MRRHSEPLGGFAQRGRIRTSQKDPLLCQDASQEDPSAKKPQDDPKWDVILNPSEALCREVKNLDASQEDPSAKKPQDDPKWDVILNPSEALRRGVKNLSD